MEGQTLMFVCFLTCSSLVVSRKFPAVSSRDLKGRQGNARHRTFNSEFRLKRDLRLNKQVIPGSPSRKRYSRYVFSGPEKRSLNSETSAQDRKLKDLNDGNEGRLSGATRTKRSTADHPQKDVPAFLLYSVGTAIKKLTLDNNVESTLVQLNGSPAPLFLDFHYKEDRLYWADSNSIHRSFLNNGTGIQTIHRDLPTVKGLAIDWFGNNIYWLVQNRIMVSRTDGRYLKTLKIDPIKDSNLMLNPEKGYMYWFSSVGDKYGENAIIKAPMYGEVESHILKDLPVHTHFAIDYYDRNIYWTGASDDGDHDYPSEIKSYKLDTDEIHDVKQKTVVVPRIWPPMSLAVSEEYVYWIEWKGNSILRANKTAGHFQKATTEHTVGDGEVINTLTLVHWGIQKDFVGSDGCTTRKYCSHFCFPDPSSHLFRCECPDNTTAVGVKYWNRTCVCPGGQFMDLNGDCTYLDAPWNVIATPLNKTAIKLTWLRPKASRSDQMMFYIFRGIYPKGVRRWPFDRTSSTSFVIGHLKSSITYMFAVSHGIQGHKSLTADIKIPSYELIPPSKQPLSTSSEASLSHAPTTKPKSSTKPPQSSSVSSLSTVSQPVTTNARTSQSTVTKRPSTSLTISSTQRSPSSGHSQLISSSATATTSREKPPLSSEASSFSTSPQEVPTNSSQSAFSGPSQSTPASPSNPLPLLQKNKRFPYWTIGAAGGGLLLLVIIVITIIFLVRRYKRRTTEGEAIDASATFPLRDPVEGVDYDDEEIDTSGNERFLPQLEVSDE